MRVVGTVLAATLVALVVLPMVALVLGAAPADWVAALRHPMLRPALGLSVVSTGVSLAVIVIGGTPLAWWIARSPGVAARATELLVDLPVVLPPAVVGVALLQAFGRRGLLGPALDGIGVHLPFSPAAVVLAQVVVASPFFVQAAVSAFRGVDADGMIVARTLGASPGRAFLTVALPLALPGLAAGAALAGARAFGEFGATLVFAGNLTGRTQSMPLAIYTALESDIGLAVVLSLLQASVGVALLILLRMSSVRRP